MRRHGKNSTVILMIRVIRVKTVIMKMRKISIAQQIHPKRRRGW
jgi:hypothetical protein